MKNRLILDKNEIISELGNDYKNISNIFSDKFGIVNAMLCRYELEKYGLHMYQCLSANTKELFRISREVSSGGLGIHKEKKYAIIGCLAEALERYSMSFIPEKDIKLSSLDKIENKRRFDDFYVYNEKQYLNNKIFSNPYKDSIYWTKIYSIKNKKDWKYWPASLIYLPFDLESPVAENTSTGMAAGLNIRDCIKSGLLELIERDAIMINFMQKLNPPEINIDEIGGFNKDLISKIKREYNIKIYKLYSDINVPIYLSFVWNKKLGKIHFGIGASANLDSDYAINKALKECLFTYFYSNNIMKDRKKDPNKINALYEHFLYYQGSNFNKLLFDSEVIKYKRERIKYEELLYELKKNNIDVYYKELTTPDIVDTGIKVVKVIAPGLIDLNKSHLLPRLGANRFWEVPKKLHLEYTKELRKDPHPFP